MSPTREQVAVQAIELARTQVLAGNHFLAAALGRLRLVPAELDCAFATDGRVLAYDIDRVVQDFADGSDVPTYDVLHTALHCVLLHPFSVQGDDRRRWNLACDICVERVVAQLVGPRPGARGVGIADALAIVETVCSGSISAQRVYKKLRTGVWDEQLDAWEPLFASDNHKPWYEVAAAGFPAPEDADGYDADATPGDASQEGEQESGASVGREVEAPADDDELREEWKRIARNMKTAIESMPREWGKRAGILVEEVQAATRTRVDYARWLRQFASLGEHLKLSDEDFDPVFYTYGLQRYGNLPLIEPLEQHEERRIREFVIVIDTSQSVSGDAVRRFVDETCSILKSTETFAERVHVRILQCDAQVQSDEVITSLKELEEWGRTVELRGFGGTDFRPAFEYVDKLVEDGELKNLGGLVYFTDGWGEYPAWRPAYKVAFAFYDDDHRAEEVPPWAVQVVLNDLL